MMSDLWAADYGAPLLGIIRDASEISAVQCDRIRYQLGSSDGFVRVPAPGWAPQPGPQTEIMRSSVPAVYLGGVAVGIADPVRFRDPDAEKPPRRGAVGWLDC